MIFANAHVLKISIASNVFLLIKKEEDRASVVLSSSNAFPPDWLASGLIYCWIRGWNTSDLLYPYHSPLPASTPQSLSNRSQMHRKDYGAAINLLHSIHVHFNYSYQVHQSIYDYTKSDAALCSQVIWYCLKIMIFTKFRINYMYVF